MIFFISRAFYEIMWTNMVLHTFVVAGSCRQPQTYVKPEAAITVFSSWWWTVCPSKHVQQL